jgi:hypothetical protein
MQIGDSLTNWSDSHVFYEMYNHQNSSNLSFIEECEINWREKLLKESPNGQLLLDNSLFNILRKNNKLRLLHVTTDLEGLLSNGVLYPSGGCLVGSIYCTPLFSSNYGLKMHNLGSYIVQREAPRSLSQKKLDSKIIKPLIIEVCYPQKAYRGLAGIDYLRLGNVHLNIYRELEYLLSSEERHLLEDKIVLRMKNSADFLSICNKIVYKNYNIDNEEFVRLLIKTIDKLPILGYLYFEVVSEYLMLYSQDSFSKMCSQKGELNSWGYKELLFSAQPSLVANFNLGKFKPSLSKLGVILNKLKRDSLCSKNVNDVAEYVKTRLSFLVNARLFDKESDFIRWQNLQWEFSNIVNTLGPLAGHLIHRELRNFGRYPDFYFYFDQYKALQAWNYWNHMGILSPFNGIIPKGESGINPAYPNLKYKIYEGNVTSNKEGTFIEPTNKLDISIAPRLIDLKYTFMRNASNINQLKSIKNNMLSEKI